MEEKGNLLDSLEESKIEFINGLDSFFSGLTFLININDGVFQIIDKHKAIKYGLEGSIYSLDQFTDNYFHSTEIIKLKTALSELANGTINCYNGIFRILNPRNNNMNFFYLTIKQMEIFKLQSNDLFLGVAQDIENLNISKIKFDNFSKEIDFMSDKREKIKLLTKREREVLSGIFRCKTNSEISKELYISQSTVETHRKRIIKKLSTRNTLELLHYATAFENQLS